jgi:hypothetical protein
MPETKPQLPTGIEHLAMMTTIAIAIGRETLKHSKDHELNRKLIGTSLSVLYQAATCYRQCHGGNHMLERLCGRAYNLGCGAYHLTLIGLYDEALNLIRSLGEMTNLVMLSALDPPKIQEWLVADRRTRLSKFGPAAVRRMLEKKGYVCATEEWYREMSEGYTHVTPATKPNFHGNEAWVGGKYEEKGAEKCFGALPYVTTMLAMFICQFFRFNDLFKEISASLKVGDTDPSLQVTPR